MPARIAPLHRGPARFKLENPLNPFATQDVVVITNPGQAQMQILIKKGEELKHYKITGRIGEGQGSKAGTAYRLQDGTMVYVPEEQAP